MVKARELPKSPISPRKRFSVQFQLSTVGHARRGQDATVPKSRQSTFATTYVVTILYGTKCHDKCPDKCRDTRGMRPGKWPPSGDPRRRRRGATHCGTYSYAVNA